jgi:hypothetical protein
VCKQRLRNSPGAITILTRGIVDWLDIQWAGCDQPFNGTAHRALAGARPRWVWLRLNGVSKRVNFPQATGNCSNGCVDSGRHTVPAWGLDWISQKGAHGLRFALVGGWRRQPGCLPGGARAPVPRARVFYRGGHGRAYPQSQHHPVAGP